MDPFTRISTLPANSQGEITVLTEHLDQNNAVMAMAMRLALRGVLERGGVIEVGTVTVDGTEVQAEDWSGITLDGTTGVMCGDQAVDLASVPQDTRVLLVLDVQAGETVSFNFVDATTGEALQHQIMAYPGRLTLLEGTTSEFPSASPEVLPIARLIRTSGGVTLDGLITDRPVPAAWIRTRAMATADRPANPVTGDTVFDTTLGQPIWWDGSGWVDSGGTAA